MNFKYIIIVLMYVLIIQNSDAKLDIASTGLKAVQTIIAVVSGLSNHGAQREIQNKLDELVESSKRIESTIRSEAQRIIEELSVEIRMQTVNSFKTVVDDINARYEEEFLKYFMSNITYEQKTIDKFVDNVNDLKELVRSVRYHTVPTHRVPAVPDDRLFGILHEYLLREANNARHCELGMSRYKVLYGAYSMAVLALAKGSIMVSYTYKYLQQGNNNTYKSELHDVETFYIQSAINISDAAREVMARASRAITRCNPSTYIRVENYINYSFRTYYIAFQDPFGLSRNAVISSGLRSEAFCDGEVGHCEDTNVIWACLAPPESGRRFATIIEGGRWFDSSWYYKGPIIDKNDCKFDPLVAPQRVYENELGPACTCWEPSTLKNNAFWNITALYSDIYNNRVITGIRFRTRWAITYLEIQDGLLVNGTIDPNTVRWNEDLTHMLEDYERNNYVLPDDYNLGKDDKYIVLPDHLPSPKSDPNVLNMAYTDTRFYLDDIVLPPGQVVTGVKFTEYSTGHILLSVAGTEAYDIIGEPSSSKTRQWFTANYTSRESMILRNAGDPLRGRAQNIEMSKPGDNYVKFQFSDWNRDGCQSLLPFIDLQEVVTKPPAPIGGVGIFYKAQPEHGGFVALKLFDIDDSVFMFNAWYCLREIFHSLTKWLKGDQI